MRELKSDPLEKWVLGKRGSHRAGFASEVSGRPAGAARLRSPFRTPSSVLPAPLRTVALGFLGQRGRHAPEPEAQVRAEGRKPVFAQRGPDASPSLGFTGVILFNSEAAWEAVFYSTANTSAESK